MLRCHNVPYCLVEHVHLVGFQVRDCRPNVSDCGTAHKKLIDEGALLLGLVLDKLVLAALADLEEGLTSHILHTRVRLVHELKQLVDHRLKELPVGAEEARVLTHDVHDVRCYNCLVVLAPRDLAQPEEVLDDVDKKALLVILTHGAGNRSDRPAQSRKPLPRPSLPPRRGVHLQAQLLDHDILRLLMVQMRQVHQRLTHRLVKRHHLDVLEVLLDDISILIFHHKHLLGLRHPVNQDPAHLAEDGGVCLEARRLLLRKRRSEHQRGKRPRTRHLNLLVVQIVCEEVPVLCSDLENLIIVDL
mmetsp:Transcript_33911/g.66172  ORF Transcript_33911/g.66172 Transcript_33911/m.66172 type:complete len:302 (-) Transcript_33911:1363-2268(-)